MKFNKYTKVCADLSPHTVTRCGHPLSDGTTANSTSDSIVVVGYMDPVIEGTTVTFECPPQYVLIGPNATTCMGNGEWEPDPRDVECKGIN